MIVTETKLKGVFILELERLADVRGFFALSWSQREFAALGFDARLVECNIAYNKIRGTLRGMHYQVAPHAQSKVVRCTQGAIYDVAVDLRPDSPTRHQWVAVELTAANQRLLYIPAGFAHGYQTLADDTEIFYQMSEYYHSESGSGLRWNDPALGIEWPLPVELISKRDTQFDLL
jgi:dTDP-4-dehydrorhamnose 3,5-epimerase